MDKLSEIMATKRAEVSALLDRESELRRLALQRNVFRGFRAALDQGPRKLGVIAEIKKASPSKGIIDPNFDPIRQFRMYEQGGANAISILTDEQYFQGSLANLAAVSAISQIPLLRKDFICHPVQIYQAIVAGADAILLIVAALKQDELHDLYSLARDLQLDVLVEVHDRPELERALDIEADLIGINNRSLHTFQTDLATTAQLAEDVPDHVLLVSESGISTAADADRLLRAGANALLVGESLMRANQPQDLIAEFLSLELPEDDDAESSSAN